MARMLMVCLPGDKFDIHIWSAHPNTKISYLTAVVVLVPLKFAWVAVALGIYYHFVTYDIPLYPMDCADTIQLYSDWVFVYLFESELWCDGIKKNDVVKNGHAILKWV